MPELQWDEVDFLECLEVVPLVEEDWKTYYLYKVAKDGMNLTVVVRPLESYVWLSLGRQQSETPLFEFALYVRGKVRHINDKRGDYLEFADCVIVPSRASRLRADQILDEPSPQWTVELSVKPQISIRYRE